MALEKNQYNIECDIARMVLRNTIIHSKDETLTNQAARVLSNKLLFERYVAARIKQKQDRTCPLKDKKSFWSRLLFWRRS